MKRLLKWAGLAVLVLLAVALGPVLWVHTACTADPIDQVASVHITESAHQRPEANTYLTYPEWHIVYAYEGLAKTLQDGDEYQFDYLSSIKGFWTSLCDLKRESDRHGGSDSMMSTVYTIGASFTLELAFKALYEETIGRLLAMIRGAEKTPQDIYSATMAKDYASFLQQVPWYRFDFSGATSALWALPMTHSVRGWERRLALGLEWQAKAGYAKLIEQAVAAVGADELTIRTIVAGLPASRLQAMNDVTVISEDSNSVHIESPRYRAYTRLVQQVVGGGGQLVDIAGNDDILITVVGPADAPFNVELPARVLSSVERTSFGQQRVLLDVKVGELAATLSALSGTVFRLEHIHDY